MARWRPRTLRSSHGQKNEIPKGTGRIVFEGRYGLKEIDYGTCGVHPALVRETQALCESISKIISEWATYQSIQNIDPKKETDILWAQLHGFVSLGLTEQIGKKSR
jgi:hypothetical protein